MKLYSTLELGTTVKVNTEREILYSRICYESDDLLDMLNYASEHNLDPYNRYLEDIITVRETIEEKGSFTLYSNWKQLLSKDGVCEAVLTSKVTITK